MKRINKANIHSSQRLTLYQTISQHLKWMKLKYHKEMSIHVFFFIIREFKCVIKKLKSLKVKKEF